MARTGPRPCCPPQCPPGPPGPPGATGPAGPQGSTGPAGPAVNIQLLGIKQVVLPDANPGLVTLTNADLVNVAHPTARYFGLRFTGGLAEATVSVVLPKPATFDDAYFIDADNVSNGVQVILETENPPIGNTLSLVPDGTGNEVTWRQATDAAIAAGVAQSYRTRLQVRPDGVWEVPGYFGPLIA